MTRKEEIIIQSYDYGKFLLDTGFSTEEAALKCMRVAFIDGARWADENPVSYDGKAMLYVNNRSHENGYKEAVDKACKWLERNYHATPNGGYYYLPEDCIEQFKQAMKEEQI